MYKFYSYSSLFIIGLGLGRLELLVNKPNLIVLSKELFCMESLVVHLFLMTFLVVKVVIINLLFGNFSKTL